MSDKHDAVAWMRKQREEAESEDVGLSWRARRDKLREQLRDDPLWRRLTSRSRASERCQHAEPAEDLSNQ